MSSSHQSSRRSESTFIMQVTPYKQTVHIMNIDVHFVINILLNTILAAVGMEALETVAVM